MKETIADVLWIQLQTLLSDYLDIHNTASRMQHIQPVADDDDNADIASYFSKKRPAKPKRVLAYLLLTSSYNNFCWF